MMRMRQCLWALMLLLPLTALAAESLSGDALRQKLDAIFAEAKDTEHLLLLALAPPEVVHDANLDNNIKTRAYGLLAKQAEHPEEAGKIRPYLHAFLSAYAKPNISEWKRTNLARLLLQFETTQHRHAEFILDLLKMSDLAQPYPKWLHTREEAAMKLLTRLKGLQEPYASQTVIDLAPLFHQSFSHSPRVIEAALDVVDGYAAQRSAAQTDALVQAYGKLEQVWQQQRESEAKFSNSLTVWDNATEADVAITQRKFKASICGTEKTTRRNYVYVTDGDKMYATGKPLTITCLDGQEAK